MSMNVSPEHQHVVADVIRNRRTIHAFRADAPPRDIILQAIDLARWAPNHHQTEPWRFHLLGPESITAVVELNAALVTAKKGAPAGEAKRKRWSEVPGWLAVTCKRAANPLQQEEDYAACCCAIQNLSLYLWSTGIGVKWTTGDVTRHATFHEILGTSPEQDRVVGLLWYGYPEQIPKQRRQPVEAILTVLH